MDRTAAIERIRKESDAVRALGATALYIFGSTSREEANARSDVDIFVEYDATKRFSLMDLAGIKVLLEDALGVDVDITPATACTRSFGGASSNRRSAFSNVPRLVRPALLSILNAIEESKPRWRASCWRTIPATGS
jgi:uncharacterized protein